jgi:hypothetical protein
LYFVCQSQDVNYDACHHKKQNVLKIDFVFTACYFEYTTAYIL